MHKLPDCPDCGMQPSITIRNNGFSFGRAEIRCSNGCAGRRYGVACHPGSEGVTRAELVEKWEKLVEEAADGQKKIT
ncbi:hypothetical protein RY966_002391 [Enterobacter kobei]|nr:hypothetical protein [Enterobacter kobei]